MTSKEPIAFLEQTKKIIMQAETKRMLTDTNNLFDEEINSSNLEGYQKRKTFKN